MLLRTVPFNGPPKHNKEKCRPVGDKIFEFKAGSNKGKKLRVLFFYDGQNVVVCTEAFLKGEKMPPEPKARAVELREKYFEIKSGESTDMIEIIELDETEYEEEYGRI